MGEGSVDRSEDFGERLLGLLLDRARLLPPHLIAPLVAEEVARIGGRDVSILLQDYAQELLVPLPGRKLHVSQPEPIIDSPAGRAFLRGAVVEVSQTPSGVRMYLPLLDGSDTVGVMALTLDAVGDDDRRLLSRLSALVADMLVTKNAYTDQFFQARRREPMSMSAEIQWSLLPPTSMSVPQVEVAGILEPAYRIAGDSFDYALNDNILHAAVIDAMGHGLDAATMATVAIGAYRHARFPWSTAWSAVAVNRTFTRSSRRVRTPRRGGAGRGRGRVLLRAGGHVELFQRVGLAAKRRRGGDTADRAGLLRGLLVDQQAQGWGCRVSVGTGVPARDRGFAVAPRVTAGVREGAPRCRERAGRHTGRCGSSRPLPCLPCAVRSQPGRRMPRTVRRCR
ncbi:PP2C family protein-serine/threonine phosphatase [Streptomyces sp. 900116325]